MIQIKKCEICESISLSDYMKCKDHFLSKEEFTLSQCNQCGFIFVNPQPEKEELNKYYDSPEYISHSGTEKGIVNKIYKKVRKRTLEKKLKLVQQFSARKKILDIGSGSGELLNIFKENGWETLGAEPNASARNFAIGKYGLKIVDESEIGKIPPASFDVISMWHVLEHVPDMQNRMSELKRIIKPDGKLFIAVPHYDSYDGTRYGEHWAAYDVPRHLWHFDSQTLEKLFNKYGFKKEAIIPMKYDSYYVSMLSEKYIHGKQKLLKGFFMGYRSNRKARKKKHPYSSQTYVFRSVSE